MAAAASKGSVMTPNSKFPVHSHTLSSDGTASRVAKSPPTPQRPGLEHDPAGALEAGQEVTRQTCVAGAQGFGVGAVPESGV